MQTFKTYYKLLFHNKISVIIYLSIFLFISILLSSILSSGSSSFSDVGLHIGLVADQENVFAQKLIEYFGDKHTFSFVENDQDKIAKSLYWRDFKYVLVIPDDFEEKLAEGKGIGELSCMKLPGNFSSNYFEADLSLYTSDLSALVSSGYSLKEGAQMLQDLKKENNNVQIASFVNSNQNDTANNYFLYAPYCFISVSLATIGLILVSFNQKERKERIECGAASLSSRIAGLSFAIVTSGLLLFLIVVFIGILLTRGSILTDQRFPFYLINMLAVLLCSLSLGFMTGMLSNNKEIINAVVNVVSLALCFLGGIFVPQEFFGDQVIKFAKFIPTYWYVKNNSLIGSMQSISSSFLKSFALQTLILIVFAIAFFVITMVIASTKRKETSH